MASIPIVSGIYSDNGPDVRVAYPVNMMPVPKQSGVSDSYLRPADGIVSCGRTTANGADRGGINWRGTCYRVIGSKLVSVSSTDEITVLGDVGSGGYVTMDYSFDRLAIASGGGLYYFKGGAITKVSDVDLGHVADVCWVDGYFMTTDGTSLVVTELNDPLSVNPLKYGSSEADPDPIVAIIKLRNEVYALNRHTIEVFDNVGGDLFPFQRIEGAQVQKGCVGTHACCNFDETIAFLGSGRNESPSIYFASNANAQSIATQEIALTLQEYSEEELSAVKLEARIDVGHKLLYVHLPDKTLVYDHAASELMQRRVWFTLIGGVAESGIYPARNLVWCNDKWMVGSAETYSDFDFITAETGDTLETEDSLFVLATEVQTYSNIGCLDRQTSSHWGEKCRWEFSTPIVYNEARGALFQELELASLTGRIALGSNPQISTSYSLDGVTWSQDRYISAGKQGERLKRLVWWQQGMMRDKRIQRFRGDSDAHISVMRLEAKLEPLAV